MIVYNPTHEAHLYNTTKSLLNFTLANLSTVGSTRQSFFSDVYVACDSEMTLTFIGEFAC